MCDALGSLFNSITSIDWLDVIKTLASAAMVLIACSALKNWKRQDKAKREAEFLDALIEAVHAYITEISAPIALVEMNKIGMTSYARIGESDDREIQGAIAYIQQNGEQASKNLRGSLNAVQPSTIRLKSLMAKGQVFKFKNYTKCQDAVKMLTWQLDKIEGFTAVVGSTTWNWSHTKVLATLKKVLTIQPDDIRKHIQESNIAILEFAKETYSQLYD